MKMEALVLCFIKPFLSIASGLGKQKKLFIFIYHRVLDKPDFMRAGEVDKEEFSWQMKLLNRYFNVLPLSEALEMLNANQLPSRSVCITFDDGYADNYLNALPILNDNDLRATFFIANGYLNGGVMWNDLIIETIRKLNGDWLDLSDIQLGRFEINSKQKKVEVAQQIINQLKHLDPEIRLEKSNYIASKCDHLPWKIMMDNEQLINLHQSGMEIGGHTVSHPIMAKLDKKNLIKELSENKSELEKLLKTKLRYFAYPNGKPDLDYKIEQIQQVKDIGYEAAVSTQWGFVGQTNDLFQLNRFTPWDKTPLRFMLRLLIMYYGRIK